MLSSTPDNLSIPLINEYATADIFGYTGNTQYKFDASSSRYLDGVRKPLLFISTLNDNISLYKAFPK